MTSDEQLLTGSSANKPATIFISYARDDEAAVIPIERALLQRGVRVLRDKPSLKLGIDNVKGLNELIEQCHAALFFVTQKMLDSDFIWRYELPAALKRNQREPSFHIIPVLQDVSFDQLALVCSDRGVKSLADFNAEKFDGLIPNKEVQRVATRILESALALRLARSNSTKLNLCIRSFDYTPPTPELHLDVDWTLNFSEPGLTPIVWQEELLPALADLAKVLGRYTPSNKIELWIKARLAVALAVGHSIPIKSGLNLIIHHEESIWPANGPSEPPADLELKTEHFGNKSLSAIIEVAVSRDTVPAVTTWRNAQNYIPDWRIQFSPLNRPSRAALSNDIQGRSWARRIGDEVRRLWDNEGIKEIHLFLASPANFGVLLGQQLVGRHPVHIYHGDNENGYTLSCTLNSRKMV